MRLTRRLAAVEVAAGGAARARSAEVREVGVVWSAHEARIDASGLAAGEYIAADMRYLDSPPEAGEPARPLCGEFVSVTERVTRDSNDLGNVYGATGEVIGRVTELDGSLVIWKPVVSGPVAAPPLPPAA